MAVAPQGEGLARLDWPAGALPRPGDLLTLRISDGVQQIEVAVEIAPAQNALSSIVGKDLDKLTPAERALCPASALLRQIG